MSGKITLIVGPMFSGKTTEMCNKVRSFTFGNQPKKTIILKWDVDYRNGEKKNVIKTHDNLETKCFRVGKDLLGGKTLDLVNEYDVIGIDEGHFFTNLTEFCTILADKYKKIVIVAALDTDYMRNPFEEVITLGAQCEEIIKKKAVCNNCSEGNACFTYKSKAEIKGEKVIEVGGLEMYIPLCRTCFNERACFNKKI